jgi:hypothetical protein
VAGVLLRSDFQRYPRAGLELALRNEEFSGRAANEPGDTVWFLLLARQP